MVYSPEAGTKAVRIRRPCSVLTGIFWRLGSWEASRPVAVSIWWNWVWMRPSRGQMYLGSASRYVLFSFMFSR